MSTKNLVDTMFACGQGRFKMPRLDAYDEGDYELPQKTEKGPDSIESGPSLFNSLTMSYFHTGTRTIIGAKAFHCPVRDGKEWDHLAMVIRLDGALRRHLTPRQIHRV